MTDQAYLIVNFGGPRTLEEIEPFLAALLTDKDVIATRFPQPIHNLLFKRVAAKRAQKICHDYEQIGGGSPIWIDTEYIASELRRQLKAPVLTFHRYLPSTHPSFLEEITHLHAEQIHVFPMFPQFTYATTGSIARFLSKHLPRATLQKFRWIKSYPYHSAFVRVTQNAIRDFLNASSLKEEEVFFLFSAHGLPQLFVDKGDPYAYECQTSYNAVMRAFPKAQGILCYQSKFGPGEWLRPYTNDVCQAIDTYTHRTYCLFVPISFTSDHIETLFEVEELYKPLIAQKGFRPLRIPALNRRPDWLAAIPEIIADSAPCTTSMLIRRS